MIAGPPRLLAALVMLCPVAAPVDAQVQEGFRLHVVDGAGRPIEAAEVQLAAAGTVTAGTGAGAGAGDGPAPILSDAHGDVTLDPALLDASGEADVTVSAIGFREERLHLGGGSAKEATVRLSPADDASIVVTARRVSRPFSPSTLGLLDIVTDARANADPVQAANDLPSSTNVAGNAVLSLRATRPTISRLYLGEVPLFEFVRGTGVDSSTQAGSILNLGNTKDVEVYPSNPPLYLAGASGGALQAFPPESGTAGGNLALNTAAVGLTGTLASGGGGSFATVSGLYSDLQPQRAINPALSDLVSRLRLRSAGLVGRAQLPGRSSLALFAQAETEDGRYPLDVLGTRDDFRQDVDRMRLISSYTATVGGAAVTVDGAYTRSRTDQDFAGWSSRNRNRYLFLAADLAGEALGSRLTYRTGIDGDGVAQSSVQTSTASAPFGTGAPGRTRNDNTDVAAYAFASYRLAADTLVSIGARRILASTLGDDYGLQASGTVASADKHHKLIVSLGRYYGVELPPYAYDGGLARSISRQAEADYTFTIPRLRLGLSVYHSVERSERTRSALVEGGSLVFSDLLTGIGRRTVTTGVEVFAVASPIDGLEARASFTSIGQRLDTGGRRVAGANDFGYIARGALRYQLGGWGLNLAATARDGAPFTRTTGLASGPGGVVEVASGPINADRLPRYFSVDASVARAVTLSATLKPLAFLSVNDLLDRRNASSQVVTGDPASLRYRHYAGRVVTAGLSLNF